MTIEVRQLLIKSQVGHAPPPAPEGVLTEAERERFKQEILAECKAWLAQKLQDRQER